MEKIPSFTIDHNKLERGVYVSRKDTTPSGDIITTFDVRFTRPNRDAAITPEALHAMEHIVATYLRNDAEWKERVVYWGPMGCCTGNYLLLSGDYTSEDILPLLRRAIAFVADFDGAGATEGEYLGIPGATPRDCGNYSFVDLDAARAAARKYLDEVLNSPAACPTEYPA